MISNKNLFSLAGLLAGLWMPLLAQVEPTPQGVLSITAGKSIIVNSSELIERISIGFGEIAEATAVTPREVLVNAKNPGSTSLIVWQKGGGKLLFDVNVQPNRFLSDLGAEGIRRELAKELPGQEITVTVENEVAFLRGQAKDLTSAGRAVAIAASRGKVVNLLYVTVPTPDPQILLKVRFASLDRSRSSQLGFNLFSTGAGNTIGGSSTQQYPTPTLPVSPQPNNITNPFVFTDLLNLFLFRKDLNLGATLKALEVKGILQTLAEPNVLAENGKQASFLAGGEFPYPVVQGSVGGTSAITVQFREFGVRLNFIPTITPRGSIHLEVAPEVSSLDFSNGLSVQGYTVPALTTRKVKTEVELEEGQSFVIGGLLDKRVTESFQKMPLIGDVPVLGKLFQSKSVNRQNTELIVVVTPELVRPVPPGGKVPQLQFPDMFLETSDATLFRTPGVEQTGPAVTAPAKSMPFEKLEESMQPGKPLNVSSTTNVFGGGANPTSPVNNASNAPRP